MALFTVLGAKGFIGSRLSAALADGGHEVFAPARGAKLNDRPLGHVMYAIGVTGDFRSRPLDTVAAHVCRLLEVLRDSSFESLTYLSSTRVYQRLRAVGPQGIDETAAIGVDPLAPGDLYNLSKLTGESLCLHGGRPAQVVRLSNVYGPGDESQNFLSSIIRDATQTGRVTLTAAAESAKDYVSLEDVVALLPRIALAARGGIYNLASGRNTSHAELAGRLALLTGCQVRYAVGAMPAVFPRIEIARVVEEFDFRPASVLDDLPQIVAQARPHQKVEAC
jgi:nucleoside-diphosphate-sugar epimerase